MRKQLLFKSFTLLISFLMIGTSCTSDTEDVKASEEKKEENREELTQAQKDFIALLKIKYPTQVVNFITDFQSTSSAPYLIGQKATFTFSSSGMLFIDTNPEKKDGDEIELPPFKIEGKEYVWSDMDKDLKYSLSLREDNSVHEMNVNRASTNLLLSQLIEEIILEPGDVKTGLIGGNIINGELKLTKTVSTFVGKKGVVGYMDGVGEEVSFTNPNGITTDGDNLYVIEQAKTTTQLNFNLRKINIATKKVTTLATITGLLPDTTGITNDGTYVYIASNLSVTKINIASGVVSTLVTFDAFLEGITFYNQKLYVTSSNLSTIYEINATTGTSTKHIVIGIEAKLDGITTDGSFLYAASSASDSVYKIDINTFLGVFLSSSGNVEAVATDGVYVYTASPSFASIRKINITTGAATLMFNTTGYVDGPFVEGDFSKQGSFGYPTGITSDGKSLYVSEGQSPLPNGKKNNAIRKIE